jgi:putative endonuclease
MSWKFWSVRFYHWQKKWKALWNGAWAKHTMSSGVPGNHSDGVKAEALAADFLCTHGLRIITRNFRVRGGEIDLIAREKTATGEIIVFVEVRLRRSQRFGGAAASIVAKKRRRIIIAAQHWLARQGNRHSNCRFDCILLSRLEEADIEWVKHAFRADV